jgi:adenine-specific DNA-methyltransferase
MEKTELRKIFESEYNPVEWQRVMQNIFKVKTIHLQPLQVILPNNNLAYDAFELGNTVTSDERVIGFYLVNLKPNVWIEANRVSLRNLLRNIYKYSVDGALIVFIHESKWRFSFVSEIRELNTSGEIIQTETEPRRYTYLMGQGEVCRTASDRFNLLNGKIFSLNDIRESFSVEKLNKEFFKKYKEFYEDFYKYLANEEHGYLNLFFDTRESDPIKQEKPIRDFVKILLGRIVFLHFLQKKGWMGVPATNNQWNGGDIHFIQSLFKNYTDKEHFHSKALKSLFFETLNTKRHQDLAPLSLWRGVGGEVKIPYLNGGLFEQDISYYNPIDFPVDYFAGLLNFFEQYNFTIDENSPDDQEVGIDPEMLGHIFENLLEENREKGAFYTPKEIVHYMCQESLLQYLATHLPDCCDNHSHDYKALDDFVRKGKIENRDDPKNFIVNHARLIEEKLDAIKICDPAIGSGAFPMGLLQEILKMKSALDLTLDRGKAKKDIIQNSIYGVDIDMGAVEIARLRFWLSLVVDESEPQPLPSLDYKIMQGNSLLERFEDIDLKFERKAFEVKIVKDVDLFGNIVNPQISLTEFLQTKQGLAEFDISELEDKFFNSNDVDEKKSIRQKIENFEKSFINQQLEAQIANKELFLDQLIEDLKQLKIHLNKATQGTTNADEAKHNKAHRNFERKNKEIEKQKLEIQKLKEKQVYLKDLSPVKKPWFLWHLYFMDVFDQGGFDIVIGNPPYIAFQRMPEQDRTVYENGNFETFDRTGDIYCLFYEKGVELLRTNGLLCYITSNKWMSAGYGSRLRDFFVQKTNPLQIIDLAKIKLFESATVFVNIFITQNTSYKSNLLACIFKDDFDFKQQINSYFSSKCIPLKLSGSETWRITDNIESSLNNKLLRIGRPLSELDVEFYRGITSGLNQAYHINLETRDKFIKINSKYNKIIKPLLRGKDIKRYKYEYCNTYIFFIPWHFPLHNDPKISNASDLAEKSFKKDYPDVYNHLNKFKSELSRRNKAETGIRYEWYALQRYGANFWKNYDLPKLVWIEISDRANYSYDDSGFYLTNSAYFLTSKTYNLKFLLAILNARLSDYYFFQLTAKIAGGRKRYTKQYVEQVLIPQVSEELQKPLIFIVDQILSIKKQNPQNDTTALEHQIDVMVYHLYKLTFEEAKVIDPGLQEEDWLRWKIDSNLFHNQPV